MGGGTAPAAVAVHTAKQVQQSLVNDLKRQINQMIEKNQPDIDLLQNLIKLLQALNLDKVYEVMKNMDQQLSLNFQMFLEDQKKRFTQLTQINKQSSFDKETLPSPAEVILKMIGQAAFWMTVGQAVSAWDPFSQIITGVFLILQMVSDIKELARLSDEKQKLQEKKAQIQKFFSADGQFVQNQLKLVKASSEIVKNFYMLVLNGANFMKSLSIQIIILKLDAHDKSIDYQGILNQLKSDVFSYQFQLAVLDTFKIVSDINQQQNYDSATKIKKAYTVLDILLKKYNCQEKIQTYTNIIQKFTKDQNIAKQLKNQYKNTHYIQLARQNIAQKFKDRLNKQKDASKIKKYDAWLLERLQEQKYFDDNLKLSPQQLQQKKRYRIAFVVSSFTTTFFAQQSSNGQTLYGYNLSNLAQKSRLLGYIGVADKINGFLLPEPTEQRQKKDWIFKKNKLLEIFENNRTKNKVPEGSVVFTCLMMRMVYKNDKIHNSQANSTLLISYVLAVTVNNTYYEQEVTLQEWNSFQSPHLLQLYSTKQEPLQLMKQLTQPIILQSASKLTNGFLQNIVNKKSIQNVNLPKNQILSMFFDLTDNMKLSITNCSINLFTHNITEKGAELAKVIKKENIQRLSDKDLEILCSKIDFTVNAVYSPGLVHDIIITKKGEIYQGQIVLESSEESESMNFSIDFTARLQRHIVIKNLREVPKLTLQMRGRLKEIYIVSVEASAVICWYLD